MLKQYFKTIQTGYTNKSGYLSQHASFFKQTGKRSIVNTSGLKNTLRAFNKNKELSPIYGAALQYTGALTREYDLAVTETQPSATSRLLLSLFYKMGGIFKQTENKTLPAYSLTPKILAIIMHHLVNETLSDPAIRKQIYLIWRKQHHDMTASKLRINKVYTFFDTLMASRAEYLQNDYPLHTTEIIMSGFLIYKAKSRADILEYLKTLDQLDPVLDKHIRLLADSRFDETDVQQGINLIQDTTADQSQIMFVKNEESILLTLILMNHRLPKVLLNYFGYKNQPQVPDCIESTIHNIINELLYDDEDNRFNFSLLPADIAPHENLKKIYETHDFRTDQANSIIVGQAYMDFFADGKDFIYRSDNYELRSDIRNFVPAMSLAFGLKETTCEGLSKRLSDDRRTVTFLQHANKMTIIITPKNKKPKQLLLSFDDKHCTLTNEHVCEYQNVSLLNSDIENLLSTTHAAIARNPMLLPILYKSTKNLHLGDALNQLPRTLESVNYLIMHFSPTNVAHAMWAINFILQSGDLHTRSRKFIIALAQQFENMLLYAVISNKLALVKTLLDVECNPNVSYTNGNTLLHETDNPQIIKALLTAGANCNAANDNGITPLHQAKTIEIVNLLLSAGADPEAVSKNGVSILEFAKNRMRTEIIPVISEAIYKKSKIQQTEMSGYRTNHLFANTISHEEETQQIVKQHTSKILR